MKVIIAGPRDLEPGQFYKGLLKSHLVVHPLIDTVISGGAPGADSFGELWAYLTNKEVIRVDAEWDDLDAPGAYVKTRGDGKKYNARAGFDRNEKMAQIADALLLIRHKRSPGSDNMLELAKKYNLRYEVVDVD